MEDGGCVPQARDQRGDVLQLEEQVRRARCIGGSSAESAGERERQAEEAAGRGDAGQRGTEGSADKKMVTPAAKREAVAHLVRVHEMSERRAGRLLGSQRMTGRYRLRRPSGPEVREPLGALAPQPPPVRVP